VGDKSVGLDDIVPGRAGGLQAGVEVLESLFELGPHIAWADNVAGRVPRQLAGDVDGLARARYGDDVRIRGNPIPFADIHAFRLGAFDLYWHRFSPCRV